MNTTVSGLGSHILVHVLLKHGQTPSDIEKVTGIVLKDLANIENRISVDMLKKLAEMAYNITGYPDLGLRLASDYVGDPHHLINHLMISCSTLLEGYQYLSRYARIDADFRRLDLREEGENIAIVYSNVSDYQAVWITELQMTANLIFCQSYGRENIYPVEMRLSYPAPDYLHKYEKLFQTSILFDMNETALVLSKDDLQTPVTTANPSLKLILAKLADELLNKIAYSGSLREKVEQYIRTHLSSGAVDIKSTSEAMAMDRSTLRRQLKKEGISFSHLLSLERQSLSLQNLRKGVSINEISDLLGYADCSSFQHAFKRWFGKSPRAYYKSILQ